MVRALVVMVLLSSTALAAPAKKKAAPRAKGPEQTMLLIWGGGAAPKDAEDAKAHFSKQGFTSSAPLTTFFSTNIKGLKPGWHIAVLGACPGPQAQSLLRRARRFYDGVYLRRVPREGAVAALTCPKLTTPKMELFFEPGSGEEPTHVTDSEEVVAGGHTLQVNVDVTLESNGEAMSASYEVVATLLKDGKQVDQQTVSQPSFARVDALTQKGNTVLLETTDTSSDCGMGSWFEAEHRERVFSVKGGKVDIRDTVKRRESGLCSPSPEGLGPCEIGCANARFEASQQACDNATRDKCDAVLFAYDRENGPCTCDEEPAQGDGAAQ